MGPCACIMLYHLCKGKYRWVRAENADAGGTNCKHTPDTIRTLIIQSDDSLSLDISLDIRSTNLRVERLASGVSRLHHLPNPRHIIFAPVAHNCPAGCLQP